MADLRKEVYSKQWYGITPIIGIIKDILVLDYQQTIEELHIVREEFILIDCKPLLSVTYFRIG